MATGRLQPELVTTNVASFDDAPAARQRDGSCAVAKSVSLGDEPQHRTVGGRRPQNPTRLPGSGQLLDGPDLVCFTDAPWWKEPARR
jgi:hypothetical protein